MGKGYVLAEVEVTDPATYQRYRDQVLATVQAYGGRFLVRGGDPERLEGDRDAARFVLLEFDSRAAAEAWYRSQQYQDILPLRLRAANSHLFLLSGAE
jgi:uncharacterized protein (DUF1330 family)